MLGHHGIGEQPLGAVRSFFAIQATVTRTEDGTWLFVWEPDAGPYSLWLEGVLIATVDEPTYEFEGGGFDAAPPDLEILCNLVPSGNEDHPPFVRLQWRGLTTAKGYVVEQFVGGAWTVLGTRQQVGSGDGDYWWVTDAQDDSTSQQFRVTAKDKFDRLGTPIAFTFEIVRNPEKPAVLLAVTGGNLVVSAAS